MTQTSTPTPTTLPTEEPKVAAPNASPTYQTEEQKKAEAEKLRQANLKS